MRFKKKNKQMRYLSLGCHIQPQSPCPFGISPETSWLSVEIKPVAKSILSQLLNKSAGGSCKRRAERGFEEKSGTGGGRAARRRVLSPRCVRSVQAHCEFGAAAAASALFPSAAAPHRLFKTGYGANNFHREHIYSTFEKKKPKDAGAQISAFTLVRRASWSWPGPGFWPSARPNYSNCPPRPPP